MSARPGTSSFAPRRAFGLRARWLPAAMALLALAACSGEQQELQAWMDQQRREAKPTVKPIEAPRAFAPQPYAGARMADPFASQKIGGVVRVDAARAVNPLAIAEANRRKEPLEAYPLDQMQMVGSLRKAGGLVALVRVDNLLYQVRVGDHLGQNNGRVTRITETDITLRELGQDAIGDWSPRAATLQLQEQAR